MTKTSANSATSVLRRLLWSLLVLLLTAAGGGVLVWLFARPEFLPEGTIAATLLAITFSLLCYWLTGRGDKSQTNEEQQREKLLREKRCKLIAFHFKKMLRIQRRKKSLISRYDQPVYLLLSDAPKKDKTIITQMGYEAYKVDDFGNDIDFPVLFWLSEHSILISVSLGPDQQPEYLDTLCRCLNKWRPRQAVNGVLLTTDVTELLGSSDEVSQKVDQTKVQLKSFNHLFGLNLPVYNIITNMGQVNDFCQYFSGFDEAKRSEVFGATSPVQGHGGIDADWFNQEYDHLISQLIANTTPSLATQLNQDYRRSICSAPYQFGLLKQKLWMYLQRLYRGDQLTDGLNFRGFYFTHNGSDQLQHDVLASVVNHSLGNDRYRQEQQIPVQQTLFAQHLMTNVILNEHRLVGVNRRKENRLMFFQVAHTLAWIALLVGVLAVIKLDFDFQSQREARADALLDRYKEAIAASPYDIENMADNVPNLYSLNRIYALYTGPEPWYSLSFLPSSSIKADVERAYLAELRRVLIPSMENTLEKDLFVYVNLEDQSRTLALLNNYRLLFNPKRTNTEELKSYFVTTLEDQGEADSVTLAQLRVLLNDVFKRNLVPVKPNEDLEQLAKKVINQTGIEALLYQHIVNSPLYSKRIDLRNELGKDFPGLLHFSEGYIGYLVPYLYTPSGFTDLDLSVDSAILKEAISAYEGVAGASPSAAEMFRISRDLKQKYQTDYINYWRDFVASVEANEIKDPDQLNTAMTLLTTASDNALATLYTTIAKYTSVELAKAASPDEKAAAENSDAPPEQDTDKKESARQISVAFDKIHKLVEADAQGNKPVDTLLAQFTSTKAWLDDYYQTETPQQLAFKTLTADLKTSNPVSTLSASAKDYPALTQDIIRQLVTLTNNTVLSLAHEHLNSSWQKEVYKPYQRTIAPFYPFKKGADVEASLADVLAFFKAEGTVDTFYQSRLKAFNTGADDVPFLPGLLPDTGLALDPGVWQMIDKASDIRQALFLADPQSISIHFQLKAYEMSPNITEFVIEGEKPLFTYQHGPRLWRKQQWSADTLDQDKLSFSMKSQTEVIANEEFEGSWAWFRLIEPRVTASSSTSTQVDFNYESSKVRITIKNQGSINPFVENFFSAFQLPERM